MRTDAARFAAAIFVAAVALVGTASVRAADAAPKPSPVAVMSLKDQILAELHGVPIAQARASDLRAAVRKVVARNPKEAAAIIAEILAVERPDWMELAGPVTAAALEALGPELSDATLISVVRVAVELQRPALLPIVHCTARAVPPCERVSLIVDTASHARDGAAADGKAVVHPAGKGIVPTLGDKDVALPDPKDEKDVKEVKDAKDLRPAEGKAVVTPVEDPVLSAIIQTAFEARPDCFPEPPPRSPRPVPTPPPLLPIPTPQPTPPTPSTFPGVIKSPAHIDPFPVVPSR